MLLANHLRRNYGGRKAFLRSLGSWLAWRTGLLVREERIAWPEVRRLVFVCYGNICRSPYAEHIARQDGWAAASCGLYAQGGRPAHSSALEAAKTRGQSLDAHQATAFDAFDWKSGDLAVFFELDHVREAQSRFKDRPGVQLTLLGLFARPRRPHIEDPYGLPLEYFDSCYALIEGALKRMKAEAVRGRKKFSA